MPISKPLVREEILERSNPSTLQEFPVGEMGIFSTFGRLGDRNVKVFVI